jgi:hypothetical protein
MFCFGMLNENLAPRCVLLILAMSGKIFAGVHLIMGKDSDSSSPLCVVVFFLSAKNEPFHSLTPVIIAVTESKSTCWKKLPAYFCFLSKFQVDPTNSDFSS